MLREEFDLKVKELLDEEASKKFKVKYRRLGKTNLMVSEVSLGGHDWGLDGKPGIGTPEYRKERLEVIKKALDLGVNFVDTTNNYEGETLGQRLKQLNVREKFIIAYGESDNFVRNADETYIRGLVEKQLKLLDTYTIDIFMVFDFPIMNYAREMNVSIEKEIEQISQILGKLKREGKIRFSCFGTHEQDSFEKRVGKADIGNLFDILQINFNFLENGSLNTIIPYAKEHDMGIIVMTPFRKGTLLNKYWGGPKQRDRDLKKPDDLIFENLEEKELGLDWALLKYVLSVKDISTVIPGVANREQLVRNLAVSIFRDQ